ncbi:MAG: fibronectin type III domain-containing protein [Chryseobacterium sp.]|uniref:fibronectin type III domain-containing protein n=1 Tax=Chryseobacterium sp. TaxID=1871047 RepID=UPI0025BF7070|nr:fibronectin type III domain-containing protein [Chryseobacterium sp.]MCJ7932762.1 fibronectin type III domain-containing protein [Chryseobacterium sp.]
MISFISNACTTATFPYSENFDAGNGNFIFENSTQNNQWVYGVAAGNPPNAIYISNNYGLSNNYDVTRASIVHTYRNIAIPAGITICKLSFDWKAGGENVQDRLRVWLVPLFFTPAAGANITAGLGRIQVGNDFNQKTTWQTYLNNNLDLSSFAGTTMRLVFEWTNNGSGGMQPPASIDNIFLSAACREPVGMSASATTPNMGTLNWTAPSPAPANGYEYYLTPTNVAPNAGTNPTGTSGGTSVNLTTLSSNTTYYWWLRSVCSPNDKSVWVPGPSFTTPKCSTAAPTVTVSGITYNSASISWPENGGASSYIVRYRPVGTSNWISANVPVATAPANNIFNLPANLLPATLYEIEVAGVCDGTTGAYSHNEFLTKCDPAPPTFTVNNITANSALITWSFAVNSNYVLRWRKVGVAGWPNPTISLPAAPANTYTLGGLDPSTTYEVQIASQCVGETTPNPYSNPKVFTTERTCELPPSGLTITQLFPTWAEIKWDPFPGATYVLKYRKVGVPSWTEVSTSNNVYTLTGLTELTKYEMQVANICHGTPGGYTPLYYFITPTVTYCKMQSGSSAAEHISKVTVKPSEKSVMENPSGASVYTDFTGTPKAFIEMVQGSADNEIIIEKKWTGTQYNEGVAVWLDFNRNGEFDINERVFVSPPNTSSPVSGKFSVPADAFVSLTSHKYVVMRVAMQRDGIPVNCIGFSNGEVEDYLVRIYKKPVVNPVDQTDILIYPNPVRTVLYVKNISKKAKYKIYNISGQLIAEGILLNNQINVSKLINSVYVIDINDNGKTVQKKFIKE